MANGVSGVRGTSSYHVKAVEEFGIKLGGEADRINQEILPAISSIYGDVVDFVQGDAKNEVMNSLKQMKIGTIKEFTNMLYAAANEAASKRVSVPFGLTFPPFNFGVSGVAKMLNGKVVLDIGFSLGTVGGGQFSPSISTPQDTFGNFQEGTCKADARGLVYGVTVSMQAAGYRVSKSNDCLSGQSLVNLYNSHEEINGKIYLRARNVPVEDITSFVKNYIGANDGSGETQKEALKKFASSIFGPSVSEDRIDNFFDRVYGDKSIGQKTIDFARSLFVNERDEVLPDFDAHYDKLLGKELKKSGCEVDEETLQVFTENNIGIKKLSKIKEALVSRGVEGDEIAEQAAKVASLNKNLTNKAKKELCGE